MNIKTVPSQMFFCHSQKTTLNKVSHYVPLEVEKLFHTASYSGNTQECEEQQQELYITGSKTKEEKEETAEPSREGRPLPRPSAQFEARTKREREQNR